MRAQLSLPPLWHTPSSTPPPPNHCSLETWDSGDFGFGNKRLRPLQPDVQPRCCKEDSCALGLPGKPVALGELRSWAFQNLPQKTKRAVRYLLLQSSTYIYIYIYICYPSKTQVLNLDVVSPLRNAYVSSSGSTCWQVQLVSQTNSQQVS